MNKKIIRITCKGSELIQMDKLCEFQGGLKELASDDFDRLKVSIIREGFAFPISVWKTKDGVRIVDGHQRLLVVKKLLDEGYEIEQGGERKRSNVLPCNLIHARTEKEAKRKVLAAASVYGTISKVGLVQFMDESGLTFPDIIDFVSFPDNSLIDFGSFTEDVKPKSEKDVVRQDTDNECPKCGYKW
jgi:hypothetical protein